MLKKEILWREIIYQATENKKLDFTQSELSRQFGFSLSTIFNALKVPRSQGAVRVTGRNFTVIDAEKFLYIWATQRNLEKEIIYKTYSPRNVKEIEGVMPENIIFGACSAYVLKHQSQPADYDKVYIYAGKEELAEIKNRFPKAAGRYNLFVLKSDPYLKMFGKTTPDAQIFVDLWNLKDWYAKEFLKKLQEKIFR